MWARRFKVFVFFRKRKIGVMGSFSKFTDFLSLKGRSHETSASKADLAFTCA